MNLQGTVSAAATNTPSLPAHQPGDLILIIAQSSITPAPPAAGGTVPNWLNIQGAAANSLGVRACYCIATASNHTAGTWASNPNFVILVFRPNTGNTLSIGGFNVGAANNTQTVVYPAATFTKLDGSSWSVRSGARGFSDIDLANNVPTGYTHQNRVPTASNPVLAVCTRSGITAHPISDSVSVPGSNAAYRAQTIEIVETGPPVPTDETIIDDFNRADGAINVGRPELWSSVGLTGGPLPVIISNQFGKTSGPATAYGVTLKQLESDFDLLIDVITPPPVGVNGFYLFFCVSEPGADILWDGYQLLIRDDPLWILRKYTDGAIAATLFSVASSMVVAGDTVWVKKIGTTIIAYRRPSGGVFTEISRATDTTYNRRGLFGIGMQSLGSDITVRLDNLRGGPIYVPPYVQPVVAAI